MSEHIKEFKVSLYIDTNKQTIKEDFETVQDLLNYIDNLDPDLQIESNKTLVEME